MRKFPHGRGSFIALGLAATLGALAVARAASPAASSVAVPSLAEYISAIWPRSNSPVTSRHLKWDKDREQLSMS
jgi:hypothetical protein